MPFYILLALLGSIFYTTEVSAAICVQDNTADCEGLGYNQSSCAYGGVACPFNTAYWHCASWSCSDGRYSSSAVAGQDCIEVTYKGLTCYDCQEKETCASGTYETEAECKTATGRTCEKNSDGCYKAKACATGTYETSQECLGCIPNVSCELSNEGCLINADGCYEKASCSAGSYVTQTDCLRSRKGQYVCYGIYQPSDLMYYCWTPMRPGSSSGGGSGAETCSSYPFTECPEHAFCQSCTVNYGDNIGATKLKFVACDYGYYNAGSSTAPNCISCTSAKATISQDKMADFNEQCQGY